MPEIQVRIRGITQTIRNIARSKKDIHDAARDGVDDAAEYLKSCIQNKFGSYQATGGPGGGAWPILKAATIRRKHMGDSPLYETGEAMGSVYVKHGGQGTLSATVASDDPKLVNHVYGAPGAGVPQRDPFLVTAREESDNCTWIIKSKVEEAVRRSD